MKRAVWLASAVWGSGSWAIRQAAKHGLVRTTRLEARVISVGNLQAGGAGKTPIVARIGKEALERGLKVCILTRGYLSEWERTGGIIPPGTDAISPDLCGDEPALLHRLVPQAWIAVGADRVRQFEEAKKRAGSAFDLVVLDDGFQHWKIKKDVEVLAVTSAQMNDRIFRDWPAESRQADLLVWTKGEKAPVSFDEADPSKQVKVRYELSVSSERPVWILCGVADPVSVVQSARAAGLEVRRQIPLADHVELSHSDMQRWLGEAAKQGCKLAITGKDWVKWEAKGMSSSDVLVLEPELVFERGRDAWERALWR